MHRPSGTLAAGDALFNVFPSASFASGIEGLVTRPLGFLGGRAARLAFGPAQALLSSVLGNRWPAAVPAALNATLGSLSTERLTSGAVRACAALPGGSAVSETWQVVWSVRLTAGNMRLPGHAHWLADIGACCCSAQPAAGGSVGRGRPGRQRHAHQQRRGQGKRQLVGAQQGWLGSIECRLAVAELPAIRKR